MRQVVLDTETTGLEVSQGHRVIEIGCVEVVNRRLTGGITGQSSFSDNVVFPKYIIKCNTQTDTQTKI